MVRNHFLHHLTAVVLAVLILPAVLAFECRPTLPHKDSSVHFDLIPLAGEHSTSKTTETPPTTNEAKVQLSLCGDDTLKKDSELSDEDQCPDGTKVCLTLLNHKQSSSEGARVTAVIPIWSKSTPEDDIKTTVRDDGNGLDIDVSGSEYAGTRQRLKLNLICSSDSKDDNPTFESYSEGVLTLSWSTPSACATPADGSEDVPLPGETKSSGSGIGSFFKFIFWVSFFGLLIYFIVGAYYNYTTYGSRGLDLLPHKDFWVDLPGLAQDLFSHLASNIRGGNSSGTSRRSGYTSLG